MSKENKTHVYIHRACTHIFLSGSHNSDPAKLQWIFYHPYKN